MKNRHHCSRFTRRSERASSIVSTNSFGKMDNETFEVVCWPESQMLMELDGFEENSYLVNDDKGLLEFGSSAYFVNRKWLEENVELNTK